MAKKSPTIAFGVPHVTCLPRPVDRAFYMRVYYPLGLVYGVRNCPDDFGYVQTLGSTITSPAEWIRPLRQGDRSSNIFAVCWAESFQIQIQGRDALVESFGGLDAADMILRSDLARPRVLTRIPSCWTTQPGNWLPHLVRRDDLVVAPDLVAGLTATIEKETQNAELLVKAGRDTSAWLSSSLRAKIQQFSHDLPDQRGPALIKRAAKYLPKSEHFLPHLDSVRNAVLGTDEDYFWDEETQANVQNYLPLRETFNLL